MKLDALSLPRISCTDREQEKMTDILNDLSYAKSIVTFYETSEGESKFLFTDFSEKEFIMVMQMIHRHVQVFDFFKLIIATIEECRKDSEKGYNLCCKAIEYIKLRAKSIA